MITQFASRIADRIGKRRDELADKRVLTCNELIQGIKVHSRTLA